MQGIESVLINVTEKNLSAEVNQTVDRRKDRLTSFSLAERIIHAKYACSSFIVHYFKKCGQIAVKHDNPLLSSAVDKNIQSVVGIYYNWMVCLIEA